jgi:copper(I)-binding protein
MKFFFLAASLLALTACGNATAPTEPESANSAPLTITTPLEAPIEINGAFIRPPFPGRDVASAYFDITNHGADARLVSASSPVSESVEIHTHRMEDGVMKMRRVDGVDLPSGETLSFKPGSYHLMMFKTSLPEGTEDVSVTLNFQAADSVTLMVPIKEAGGEMDMKGDHKMGEGMKKEGMK